MDATCQHCGGPYGRCCAQARFEVFMAEAESVGFTSDQALFMWDFLAKKDLKD